MERAKIIKQAKFQENEGTLENFPTVLNSNCSNLLDIAHFVGLDLGASLDLAEQNIELIRLQEQARASFISGRKENNDNITEPISTTLHPSDVDAILKELLDINKNGGDGEIESLNMLDTCLVGLNRGPTNKHLNKVYSVKTPVKTVVRRRKKKIK